MQHETGINVAEARRLTEHVERQLQQIAFDEPPPAAGLRRAAEVLAGLAEVLKVRAESVGLPYPPDEA